jgi:hypothetical protein
MEENLPVQSDSAGLVARAKAILMSPKAEWTRIAGETSTPRQVLLGYALPLIAISPLAGLIGSQLFGYNLLFTTVRLSIGFAVSTAVLSFIMAIVSVFVLSFVANLVSPKFSGRDSFPAAFRLVAYAMTAAWLGGIFGLIPSLALIGALLGLYSLYLLYLGATPVMGVPEDKAVGYTVVTILAAIVLYVIASAITSAVVGAMMVPTAAIANIQ